MLFSAILIILVALVTYFHYVQGLFTSAISLACALLASLVAFGYYENVLNVVGQGKMADFSAGAMLMVLFGITYLALRLMFDALVPGNVVFPLYVERIGSAVLGLVAGILGVGVFAVAAQLMPFGPSIASAARFDTSDRDKIILSSKVTGGNGKDTAVTNEMVNNSLDPAAASGLLLPVDNLVISLVSLASGGGLGGSQSFSAIHPDLLSEAYAARVGADWSAHRTIYNTSKKANVYVTGLYSTTGVTGKDVEITDVRPNKKALTFDAQGGDVIVIRADFEDAGADSDGILRITPAAIRLTIDGVNYHPIGTMASATVIGLNRIDDQIPIVMRGASKGADFAFALPHTVSIKLAGKTIGADIGFVEFKLFGRVDLAGKPLTPYPGPTDAVKVLRKAASPLGLAKAADPAPGDAAAPAAP